MRFSKTELKVISELGKGNCKIKGIAKALNKSISQIYRIAQKLEIADLKRGVLKPHMKTHVSLLLKIMARSQALSTPLSGTGIQIYSSITTPKTIKEIVKETGLHKTTVLKKISQGKRMSLAYPEKNTVRVNEKIWPDAKAFFEELKRYEGAVDPRVPVNSIIYHKNEHEIVFSTKEDHNAAPTAFSAYEQYGIKLLTITNYYYLPKKNLKKTDILKHSLYIAEKDNSHIIFIALFYAKFKKEFKSIKHPIIQKLQRIFKGEKIPEFPSLAEIKDRAEVYHIKIR
ncbi:hypothetical protein JXC34_03295 [Candidatus Woesearchaeota archaeon]|nr:hypothetical protein [Candidatus Woesearchaeota archaeon]